MSTRLKFIKEIYIIRVSVLGSSLAICLWCLSCEYAQYRRRSRVFHRKIKKTLGKIFRARCLSLETLHSITFIRDIYHRLYSADKVRKITANCKKIFMIKKCTARVISDTKRYINYYVVQSVACWNKCFLSTAEKWCLQSLLAQLLLVITAGGESRRERGSCFLRCLKPLTVNIILYSNS